MIKEDQKQPQARQSWSRKPQAKQATQAHTTASLTRLIRWLDLKLRQAESASRKLGRWRFLTFSLLVLLILITLFQPAHLRQAWYAAILVCLGGFIVLLIRHNKLKKDILRLRLWQKIKESNLARIQLDWDQLPVPSYRIPPQHPYALDLDIVGEHSLLQLLDTTISTRGTRFLTNWLLYPEANLDKLKRRQQLVQELKNLHLFRDKLTLEALTLSNDQANRSEIKRNAINGETILARLQHPLSSWIQRALKWEIVLWLTTALSLAAWLYSSAPILLWAISYLAYMLVFFLFLPSLSHLFGQAGSLQMEFRQMKAVFIHLEKKGSSGKELAHWCTQFKSAQNSPSAYLRRINRVCDALSVQGNALAHIGVNLLCPWDFFFACRWEKLRQQMLTKIPLWLDALGVVDAASALANMAANNPDYTLPDISDKASEAGLCAKNLGHPCLPARKANDFTLKGLGSIGLITGSNMSGKSTFLKTVGINLCLAQAGGFVCASSFQSSWFRIYACIKVSDSVTEGLSYFYAEVKRLKAILEAASGAPPVLVLIDEIFKGTNNRERIIGSASYLRALIQRNIIALISTHDLEVTRISEQEKGKIINFHFQESIEDGQMKFDYRLRPGVCPTTNALKIMQLEGLPVLEGLPLAESKTEKQAGKRPCK